MSSRSHLAGLLQELIEGWPFDLDDGESIKFLPAINDRGFFQIGDGSKDMDVKIFLGGTNKYIQFDVGTSEVSLVGINLNTATHSASTSASIGGLAQPLVTINPVGNTPPDNVTTYGYALTATDILGRTRTIYGTNIGAAAILSNTAYNNIVMAAWPSTSPDTAPISNITVRRIIGGASTGVIGTIASAGGTLSDTGQAGDSTNPPDNTPTALGTFVPSSDTRQFGFWQRTGAAQNHGIALRPAVITDALAIQGEASSFGTGSNPELGRTITIDGNLDAYFAYAVSLDIHQSLFAVANNDSLVGLWVEPTYNDEGFSGVSHICAHFVGTVEVVGNVSVTQGNLTIQYSPGAIITLRGSGFVEANNDIIILENNANLPSMTNTEQSILFKQKYYDATTPVLVNAARITSGTETNWTSVNTTQDGYLDLYTVKDGVLSRKIHLGSAGTTEIITGLNGIAIGPSGTVPDTALHVAPASAGSVTAVVGTVITLENNISSFMSFLTPNNQSAGFYFGDPEDPAAGIVYFNHTLNQYGWWIGAVEAFNMNAAVVTSNIPFKLASTLRTTQSAAATGPVGTVVKKLQIFDGDGNSLGYIPIYDTIT